jgi:hypothetical protein
VVLNPQQAWVAAVRTSDRFAERIFCKCKNELANWLRNLKLCYFATHCLCSVSPTGKFCKRLFSLSLTDLEELPNHLDKLKHIGH